MKKRPWTKGTMFSHEAHLDTSIGGGQMEMSPYRQGEAKKSTLPNHPKP